MVLFVVYFSAGGIYSQEAFILVLSLLKYFVTHINLKKIMQKIVKLIVLNICIFVEFNSIIIINGLVICGDGKQCEENCCIDSNEFYYCCALSEQGRTTAPTVFVQHATPLIRY